MSNALPNFPQIRFIDPGGPLGISEAWYQWLLNPSFASFSIPPSGVTAGPYGSASSVPNYIVNSSGFLTYATNTPIAINASQITSGTIPASQFPALTGDVTTSAGSLTTTLKNTGTAGTYCKVAFDAQGRETSGSATLSLSTDVSGTLPQANEGPGSFIQSNVLTSGTTFTTSAFTNTIKVRVQAAGGGSGGANTAAVSASAGAGGSAGGYAEKTFAVTPSTGYTYAIGTGGIAGVAAGGTGGTGGNSTFTVGGTTVTANGGIGGVGMAGGTIVAFSLGGASPAISTNGDVNSGGAPGSPGIRSTGILAMSGNGGSCLFGAGGIGLVTQGVGTAGIGFGCGAAGACCENGGAAVAGAAGQPGIIIVDEYT